MKLNIITVLIIYMQKLLDSDWITKECSFSVTPVQSCNTCSANYKWVLTGSKTIEIGGGRLFEVGRLIE